jgi:hypothetical protein
MARPKVTGKKPRQTAGRSKRKDGPPQTDPKAIEPPKADSDQNEAQSTKPPRAPPPAFAQAFTIDEFCAAHRISREQYFKMQREKWGPDVMVVGTRRVISNEAAERWRRAREQAAQAAA